MVEGKCVEVDNEQTTLTAAGGVSKLQWQALITLHHTLLHEYHNFFLASQHPSASPALPRLASKYAMPARMWRHGIHSFLELMRHHLPECLDHMIAPTYIAYAILELLYETVPAFEDTWIECLGSLARYRMAIEDDDTRDREVWRGVARYWYSKGSDRAPTTGRLYHHLAILARPNALRQLFYYTKSLCVVSPCTPARESILTLFHPIRERNYNLPPFHAVYIKAQEVLFKNQETVIFEPFLQQFLTSLDAYIHTEVECFKPEGYHIALANTFAMLGFGSKNNIIMKVIDSSSPESVDSLKAENISLDESFKNAQRLNNAALEIVLQRTRDSNVLPFVHCSLAFMYCMSRFPAAISHIQVGFPWERLAAFLNELLDSHGDPFPSIESDKFPATGCIWWLSGQ